MRLRPSLLIHMSNRRTSKPRPTLDKNPLKYEYLLRAHSGVSKERELKSFRKEKQQKRRKMHFISQKKNCAIKIIWKFRKQLSPHSWTFFFCGPVTNDGALREFYWIYDSYRQSTAHDDEYRRPFNSFAGQ